MPAAAAAMSRRAPLAVTAVLTVLLVLTTPAPPRAEAALSCSTVYNTLMPCLPYVQSGGTVARACCSGIQRLFSGASTTPDRRAICTCLKDVAAGAAGGPYISRAAGLPGRCGVPLPYKLSPNMNCNSYVADTNTQSLSQIN
ncbi:hypothetical protein EJB05_24332, partial [Eragrostis curvula]